MNVFITHLIFFLLPFFVLFGWCHSLQLFPPDSLLSRWKCFHWLWNFHWNRFLLCILIMGSSCILSNCFSGFTKNVFTRHPHYYKCKHLPYQLLIFVSVSEGNIRLRIMPDNGCNTMSKSFRSCTCNLLKYLAWLY